MKGWARLLVAVGLLVAAAGHAQDAGNDEGKRLLDRFLDDVTSLSAGFDQSLVDADNAVVEESTGTLHIQRPGRFRWSYDTPYVQVLVADGRNVWSYDVDLEQVTVKPQAQVLGSTPALLLGGSENVFDDFEYVESFADRGTIWVHLRPHSTEHGFTKVELGFNDGDLRRMIFSDNLQQSTLIVLRDLELNPELPNDLFTFAVPEGADLVGVPVSANITDR
jgi:outer membrane lipoprotein carrier protein